MSWREKGEILVVNYMRIRFMAGESKRYREQIRKTIDSVLGKSNQEHILYEYGMKQERESENHGRISAGIFPA
jgi:hypothetical protein